MRTDGDAIVFNSLYEWFALEQAGIKPNTIRLLDKDEYDLLTSNDFTKVTINCINPSCYDVEEPSFTRPIIWAGKVDYVLGKVLYMVCWES